MLRNIYANVWKALELRSLTKSLDNPHKIPARNGARDLFLVFLLLYSFQLFVQVSAGSRAKAGF